MLLNLIRNPSTALSTIGTLDVDGVFECYTLERPEVQIPIGVYNVEITYSPRFNRPLPLLDSVPGRSDIRIHMGNWPKDTEGCILVGQKAETDSILYSLVALNSLLVKIQKALDEKENVSIVIRDVPLQS